MGDRNRTFLFPVQQQARNQLPLYANQADLLLKFITSQDMTGQFGNLWSQMPLEFKPKATAGVTQA